MKNTTTEQATTEAPKTVTVGVLVPWIIVIILISGIAGVVGGWNWRSTAVEEIQSSVALSSKEQTR